VARLAAILATILVITGHCFAVLPGALTPAKAVCSCCACGQTQCCAMDAAPATPTEQSPPAPLPGSNPLQEQVWLVNPASLIVFLSPNPEAGSSRLQPVFLSLTPAPIFQRDCSYLI
jgi:hypothetical protein